MSDVLYVRNTRPNAVLVRYTADGHTTKYTVERRGSREDTIALPSELRNDPIVASFLERGILEEISKEAFLALGERREGRPAYALKEKGREVNLPHTGEDSRTPFVLVDKTITDSRHLRSPNPEFAERVPTTSEELATGIRQPLPELKRALSSLESKEEKLETEVSTLSAQVSELSKLVEQQLAQNAQLTAALLAAQTAPEKTTKEEPTPAKKTRAKARTK